ncbi:MULTISPECIES: ABC transporter permease [unclassified Ferrimonas]|uniref:ABC transporter permease n=1 Tax=unclassified Ferrimonas TaxID=2620587 RepID=UPI002573E74F|nr:ABC transporter permease [Ferrimonas sp. YFM]BDY03517.1 ABC transporter permease [Ferrimonas sp. YFM]
MSDSKMPAWANVGLLPLLNVTLAFAVSALVFMFIGIDPVEAAEVMLYGALGYEEGIGYTLFYATNFIFTGLCVALAFSAGLFNIGGEGQAYIGGLGVGLACLALDSALPFWALLPITMLSGMVFGALWALIPGYLQAYRGSHIVITTIMFNFIASSLMVYLMVNVLKLDGQMAPVSRVFEQSAQLPFMHEIMGWFGITIEESPLNLAFIIALLTGFFLWVLLWHTRWGFAIRAMGSNPTAARYGGIDPKKLTVIVMLISGAMAGLVGINEVQGYSGQIKLDFVAGYGFTGIAVALMGRGHPVGIILASILFGLLFQGGAELAFEYPELDRNIVVVVQALVILFCGALEYMLKPYMEKFFAAVSSSKQQTAEA